MTCESGNLSLDDLKSLKTNISLLKNNVSNDSHQKFPPVTAKKAAEPVNKKIAPQRCLPSIKKGKKRKLSL